MGMHCFLFILAPFSLSHLHFQQDMPSFSGNACLCHFLLQKYVEENRHAEEAGRPAGE